MIRDLRRVLDPIGKRVGLSPAARPPPHAPAQLHGREFQALDRGAAAALYTVARELDHSSTDMIEDRYGHLHDRAAPDEAKVGKYRVETQTGRRSGSVWRASGNSRPRTFHPSRPGGEDA